MKHLMALSILVFGLSAQATTIQKIQPDELEWGVKVARHVILRAIVLDPKHEMVLEKSVQFPERSKSAVDVVRNTVFNTKEGSACTLDVKESKKLWVVKASCYDRKNKARVITVKVAQPELLALR